MNATTPTWRKSSYSTNTPNCVELADTGTAVLVRDSKHPELGHIALAPAAVAAFIATVKTGRLDHLAG